ncbi:MAG TPA: EAL domain-containing protein [Gammaproteobacteria bacterium]|nr:EAL domain-containing protein [Gammaproteobacteria bacterium]
MANRGQASTHALRRHHAGLVIAAGVLYFLVGIACIHISLISQIAQIWLSNAILLIIMFRSEPTLRPWYFVSGLIANLLANLVTGTTLLFALSFTFSTAIELSPALLLPMMMRSRPTLPIILPALIFTSLLASLVSGALLPFTSSAAYFHYALNWFSTDLLGILMLMPLGLSYTKENLRTLIGKKHFFEFLGFSIAGCFIIYFSLQFAPTPFLFMTLVLLCAAFRLNLFESALLCFLNAIVFITLINTRIPDQLHQATAVYSNFGYLLISLTLIPCIIIAYLIETRNHQNQQLRESERRFRFALDAGKIGVFELHLKDDHLDWDSRMMQLYDMEPSQISHHRCDWERHVDDRDLARVNANFNRTIKEGIPLDDEFRIITRKGNTRHIRAKALPVYDENNQVASILGLNWDVTQEKTLENELTHQATHDELTGLINRREFEELLKKYLNDTRGNTKDHVIAFLDLDRFKVINDTAGHAAGDALLKTVANILEKNIRTTDIVARIGGDEFALILPNCSLTNAKKIAAQIVKAVNTYRLNWENKIYDIGISIGLVHFHPKEITLERLLSQADTACYDAKHLGSDRVSVYIEHKHTRDKLQAEIKMMPRIHEALEKNQFVLYARETHPTKETHENKTTYEILLRMIGEDGQLIMPNQFIKIAERHHIMPSIDEWVLHELLINQQKAFQQYPDIAISINLSHQSIHTPSFHEKLKTWLETTAIHTTNIGFELTERALQENMETTIDFLKLIESAGCFVSLDDFGSGLSSFTYLKNFPMKFVKIDSQFIRMLAESDADRIIVESINTLAHRLEAKTIAEYVDTPAILHIVKSMNIDYMQGNALSHELPLQAIFQKIGQVKEIITD